MIHTAPGPRHARLPGHARLAGHAGGSRLIPRTGHTRGTGRGRSPECAWTAGTGTSAAGAARPAVAKRNSGSPGRGSARSALAPRPLADWLARAGWLPVAGRLPVAGWLPVAGELPAGARRGGVGRSSRAQRGPPGTASWHPPRITRAQGRGHGREQRRDRELVHFFLQVPHFLPGDDDLEHATVDLPVAELPGVPFVHAEIDDVQPVAEIIQDEAWFAAVVADRAGLPQRVDLAELDVLAPDAAGRGGEAVLLGRRRGGEQRDVTVGGTHGSLV